MEKVETVIELLVNRNEDTLTRKYSDHELKGSLKGLRELPIEGDWLLTYKINNDVLELFLIAMGGHGAVFRKSKMF